MELTEENLIAAGFISNPYMDRYEKDGVYVECDKTKGFTDLWVEGMPKIKTIYDLEFYIEMKKISEEVDAEMLWGKPTKQS
jgi:hypothetical protein